MWEFIKLRPGIVPGEIGDINPVHHLTFSIVAITFYGGDIQYENNFGAHEATIGKQQTN